MHASIDVLERLRRTRDEWETAHPERGIPRPQASRPSSAKWDDTAPDVTGGIDRFSPSSDWDGLIHQVEAVAHRFRETERRAQERECRIEQLLVRAEHELTAGAERVRAAEARACEIESWAEQAIASATGRAQAAEARSQNLAAIFDRLREAILAGCAEAAAEVAPAVGQPPDTRQAPRHIRRVA